LVKRGEVGGQPVSRLTDYVAAQLARKVQAHGLVVWQDEVGEYRDVAAACVPDGTLFEAWAGSAYELRRRVESRLGGATPPRLVIYVDRTPPKEDPLAEIREAAGQFKLRLPTLVRQALTGQLTEARLTEIGRQARTLAEAEAALAGDGRQDVRVVALLGTADATGMALLLLGGNRDGAIEETGAWPAIVRTLHAAVGGKLDGKADELKASLFRHLLLTALAEATGGIPEDLAMAWAPPTAEQRRRALDVFRQLQIDPSLASAYFQFSRQTDTELELGRVLRWQVGLDSLIGTEAVEEVVFEEAARRLNDRDPISAARLAAERLKRSPWVRHPEGGAASWGRRWVAVQRAGSLLAELDSSPPPKRGRAAELLGWYVASGFRVDRAQRRLELARVGLSRFGALEDVLARARSAYHEWLDKLAQAFSTALEAGPLEVGDGLVRQGEIHDHFVSGVSGPVAYLWVDALRYELGADLREVLVASGATVELHGALAAPPTVTLVGMANLLPGAAAGLRLGVQGDSLVVSVAGQEIKGVPERRDALRARHPRLVDLELDHAAQLGDRALAKAIDGADLVLVRSGEVDAAGETDLLSVGWSSFEATTALLATVITRLLHAGISRVVATADHGFIALGEDLGPSWVVDPPSGASGVLKRRVFLGRGGSTSSATVRVPLAATGIPGDLDLIVPRGVGVFRAGGARQFFHGGLSPQELLVPVIVVTAEQRPVVKEPTASLTIAGGRVTTGAFGAVLQLLGDLFTPTAVVRISAVGAQGEPVAQVVAGDGYDPVSDTLTLTSGQPAVVTFQVTSNLASGSQLRLFLLDARTGRVLAEARTQVAATIQVEDDLG
jgi:hypothetical protein